jgi:outer membrane protein TolC
MGYLPRLRRRLAWVGCFSSIFLPISVSAQTTEIQGRIEKQLESSRATTQAQATTLSLADCLRIAHERQPALQAYQASLAAAESASRGLQNMRLAGLIVREIPVRREQACLGITAAAARLEQAERETDYAVTRTYFSILFARDQRKVANKVWTELNDALENAKRLVKGGAKKPTQNDVERTEVYLRLAELKQEEAETGLNRALAGLREAMGVGPDYAFEIVGDQLPDPKVTVNKQEIISLAISRRAELTQADVFAQNAALEVDAQGKSRRRQFHTFASGADIHANPIPQGSMDDDYKPGAVGPEMPGNFAGKKRDRQDRAENLSARAGSMVEKTRGLIALEAQDAFLKWEQNTKNASRAHEAADKGDKLAERIREDFKALGEAVDYKEVLEAVVLASQARAQYNEAKFKAIVALAALERITGGGFQAGLAASK